MNTASQIRAAVMLYRATVTTDLVAQRQCDLAEKVLNRHYATHDQYNPILYCIWCHDRWPCADIRDLAYAWQPVRPRHPPPEK